MTLPRILFVLGKGGVGRSTVATALGLCRARRGERVLVFEWTISEPIAPWFGLPPAGTTPCEVERGLSVMTYDFHDALRAYFAVHLHLPRFHKHVIQGAFVRRLLGAAPGFAELLFLGSLWWLTTLAEKEAGLAFDRIIVDTPATGHGASILDMPATLADFGAAGLLKLEIDRVTAMTRDPGWSGAVLVSTPEELALTETLELLPRVTGALERPPLLALVNRATSRFVGAGDPPGWLEPLERGFSPEARQGLATLHAELAVRARLERALRDALARRTERGVLSLDDQLLATGVTAPCDVARALSVALEAVA